MVINIHCSDEFTRPLLLQERVDGLDSRVQELVRNMAGKTTLPQNNSGIRPKSPKEESLCANAGNAAGAFSGLSFAFNPLL